MLQLPRQDLLAKAAHPDHARGGDPDVPHVLTTALMNVKDAWAAVVAQDDMGSPAFVDLEAPPPHVKICRRSSSAIGRFASQTSAPAPSYFGTSSAPSSDYFKTMGDGEAII